MEWLQACKDQAMIGCPSWNKVRSAVEEDLARKVKPQLNDISRRQVLIELLGPQFTKKYIPNQPGDPFPESTIKSSKKKEKLVQEMKSWLKKEMDKILLEKGLKDSSGQPQGELMSFMNQSGDIVSKNVKKQLRQGRNGDKGSNYKRSGGLQNSTEIVGTAMTSFIEDSPELVPDLTKSLKKYTIIFPHSLRPHLWRDYLIRKETQKKKGKGHYQQIIDSFQKSLSISMKELKLTRVTRSSIWKQIDKEVLQIYHKTNNSTDEDITETAQLLNIVHIYNKSYHLYYIYWAIMIQQIFLHNDEFDKGLYQNSKEIMKLQK
ncbi:uncharacterized protein [Centruroides vittatus]|uniref:uncharacterized protein n=1 Tax=Centruroides vittatus TaxID=120091 RepID=UPI00350EB978